MISVIVPVYNAENTVERCLDSLIGQHYRDFEVLVIDDGSTDRSPALCDRYASLDARIKVFHTDNSGVSAARNKALNMAQGDIISFVDSDDWLEPTFLEELFLHLEDPSVDVVRLGYNKVHGSVTKGAVEAIKDGEYTITTQQQKRILMTSFMKGEASCYTWLLGIRSNLLTTLRFNEDLSMMEDVVFYGDLIKSVDGTFKIQSVPLYNYVYSPQGASKNPKNFTRNAKDTATVNLRVYSSLYDAEKDYGEIAAMQLSITVSRYVSYAVAGSLPRLTKLRSDVNEVVKDENFIWLAGVAQTERLRLDHRVSVWAFCNKHITLLYLMIVIRRINTIIKEKLI